MADETYTEPPAVEPFATYIENGDGAAEEQAIVDYGGGWAAVGDGWRSAGTADW